MLLLALRLYTLTFVQGIFCLDYYLMHSVVLRGSQKLIEGVSRPLTIQGMVLYHPYPKIAQNAKYELLDAKKAELAFDYDYIIFNHFLFVNILLILLV